MGNSSPPVGKALTVGNRNAAHHTGLTTQHFTYSWGRNLGAGENANPTSTHILCPTEITLNASTSCRGGLKAQLGDFVWGLEVWVGPFHDYYFLFHSHTPGLP